MLLDVMVGIPPITHGTPITTSEAITALVIIAVFVVLVMVTSYLVGVAGYRRIQRQSKLQEKEAERPVEASPEPKSGKQLPVRTPVRLPNLT